MELNMKRLLTGLILSAGLLSGCSLFGPREGPERILPRDTFEDKVRGGWAGQMIGVSYGAPTEFRFLGEMITGDIKWQPDMVTNSIEQDDLYVEMTFSEVMDRVGLDATIQQYGEAFKNSKYHLWHANAGARRNLNRGIPAPWSGHPKYNLHANDIDFQIEADFIGLMCPGLPLESNKYCDRVGRVMNYGDGLYGGMFVCGMYSAAYFQSNARDIVESGLACIPKESGYAEIIFDVLTAWRENPDDWTYCWKVIEKKWGAGDPCPDGAQHAFNIDARLNGAYIAIGLLYGAGDFAKTVEITTRCGQDSDCNPASAAGILGVVLGYDAIPENWKSGIAKIENQKFSYTNYSFNDIVASSIARTGKIVAQNGGVLDKNELRVITQYPKAPPLEQFDMGIPTGIIHSDNPAWKWGEGWTEAHNQDKTRVVGRTASRAGASATLTFEGSAIALVGHHTQDGGRADIYLDGVIVGEIDQYIVENTHDNDLWHAYDLTPGEHTLKIILRPDKDARSKGQKVLINFALTYDATPSEGKKRKTRESELYQVEALK